MKIAYIDSQNIKMWVKELGREIDRHKFYIYLKMKYRCDSIKFFVWYIDDNKHWYDELSSYWYQVVFKKTLSAIKAGKWNIDTLLMLHGITDINKWLSSWFLISGDWDFDVLIEHWKEHNIEYHIMIPNHHKASQLLKDVTDSSGIVSMHDLEHKIKKTT
jgi:uncharacterized LabA/DUF88 family protein